MGIPKETQDRIEQDAKVYCPLPSHTVYKPDRLEIGKHIGYIAGATAEAERAQHMADALQIISDLKSFTDKEGFVKQVADNALQQWKDGKGKEEIEPTISKCGMCHKGGVNQYLGNQFYLCDECFEDYEKGRDQPEIF